MKRRIVLVLVCLAIFGIFPTAAVAQTNDSQSVQKQETTESEGSWTGMAVASLAMLTGMSGIAVLTERKASRWRRPSRRLRR